MSDLKGEGSKSVLEQMNQGQDHNVDHDHVEGLEELLPTSTSIALQLNELVAEIFKYLPTKDVKSCSLVNPSVWRKEARKILVKRTQVKFESTQGNEKQRKQKEMEKIEEYMNIMGNDCHRTVSFGVVGVGDLSDKLVRAFGNKYGNQIQDLSLVMVLKRFGRFNLTILESFPNIETLTVSIGEQDSTDGSISKDFVLKNLKSLTVKLIPGIPKKEQIHVSNCLLDGLNDSYPEEDGLVKSLLPMCPSLEELTLHGHTQYPFLLQLGKAGKESRIPKTITRLIFIGMSGMEPSLIMNLPFQLTVLEIDLYKYRGKNLEYSPWPYWLQRVLFKFAPNLRHLGLHRFQCARFNQLNGILRVPVQTVAVLFPRMPNLEILEITHHVRSCGNKGLPQINFTFECGPVVMDYTDQFPALKELTIKQVEGAEDCGWRGRTLTVSESQRNTKASWAFCDMLFPRNTTPCITLEHIDVDCASGLLRRRDCQCGRYCFCFKSGRNYDYLIRMANVFPNAVELQNFIALS